MSKRIIKVLAFYFILFFIIAAVDWYQHKTLMSFSRVCMHYDFGNPVFSGWAVGDMFCPNDAVMTFKYLVSIIGSLFSTWPVRYAFMIFSTVTHAILFVIRGYI